MRKWAACWCHLEQMGLQFFRGLGMGSRKKSKSPWQAPYLDLNCSNIEHLAFYTKAASWWATHPHPVSGKPEMVTKEILIEVVEAVKTSCVSAAQSLMQELTSCFPAPTLIDALGFCYPQYWLQEESSTEPDSETTFPMHLNIVKAQYGVVREVKDSTGVLKVVPALLSVQTLVVQSSLFKVTMQSNSAAALKQPFDSNPFTRIWRSVTGNALLRRELSEYIKLAEIAAVQVLGSDEDKRTFNFELHENKAPQSTSRPLANGSWYVFPESLYNAEFPL